MLQSTRPVMGKVTGRKKRGTSAATRGLAPFLSLPKMPKGFPLKARTEGSEQGGWLGLAKLMLNLVDADLIEVTRNASAKDLVTTALSNWMSKHLADVQILEQFYTGICLDKKVMTETVFPYAEYDDDDTGIPTTGYLMLESNIDLRYVNILDGIQRLEQAKAGLGRTALHYAEMAGNSTVAVFSPATAFERGVYFTWNGCDNDKDYLEEMGSDEEGNEDDYYLPSHYRKSFPEIFMSGDHLPREALEEVAHTKKGEAGTAAELILSIMDSIDSEAGMLTCSLVEQDSVGYSCILGAASGTEIDQELLGMHDSFIEYANMCADAFTRFYGFKEFPLEPEGFMQSMKAMEDGFALYTNLDRLIRLIGTEVVNFR